MFDLLILVLVEISYLITGLGLCIIGRSLIVKGFETKFEGEGIFGKKTIRVLTTSPGLVFMIAGLIIISLTIIKTTGIHEKIISRSGIDYKIEEDEDKKVHKEKKDQTKDLLEKISSEESENDKKKKENLKLKKDKDQLKEKESKTITMPLEKLVERTIKFAQENPNRNFAEQHIIIAKENINRGDVDMASTNLSIAIVIDPNLLNQILKDQDLKQAIINPYFDAIVRARLALPQQGESFPDTPLSALAEEILKRIRNIVTLYDNNKPISEKAYNIVASIPLSPNEEKQEITIKKLTNLLSEEPRLLLQIFEEREYQWLLHNEKIIDAVQLAIINYIDENYRSQ